LPFIDLLTTHLHVAELPSGKDFRLQKLAGRPLYFTPADRGARLHIDALWEELTGGVPPLPVELPIKGRVLRVPRAAMGVARFAFAELCERPLGANDFLHLSQAFHTLVIEDIPVLGASRNVTRRFVNLIDTLYDNRVGLIASAAAEPGALCTVTDMRLLWERTASRLVEMRSSQYLSARLERLHAPAPA